ncbi:MAG: phosphatase PAP2 family protein [Steroidobacteraceae bacterium]
MSARLRRALGPLAAATLLALAAGCASVPAARVPAGPGGTATLPRLDSTLFLAPPPAADSELGRLELARVREVRTGASAARLAQAVSDNELEPWTAFAAALGRRVDPAAVPANVALMARVREEVLALGGAKDHYRRPRPFVADPTLGSCLEDPAQRLRALNSWSYPSGHATYGWTVALLLSELLPERAGPILDRGRDYGESRVVCGLHYPSDLDAGRLVGAALVARLHGDSTFLAQLDRAREELRRSLALH